MTKSHTIERLLKSLPSGSETGQSMMGTRDPTTPQPIKLERPPTVVERHPVQRKDPGMNAEKLNIRAPPPPPPSPTHADNLVVSPFLVTDHPSRKPAQRPPAESIIQSPFLVDPTKYPFAEEPIMFDLEDVLMESEIYPLAPPNVPSEEFPTPQDQPIRPEPSQPAGSPKLPSMADMISELTGLALSPSPPTPPQQFPSSLLQDTAERPVSRPEYVVLLSNAHNFMFMS